jgi:hypothetical protein
MLKCGLSWREFAALSKTAFVAAATADYGIAGRPTNVSRTALLCGLSRKEVKRQRDLLTENSLPAPPEKTTDATRVLSGWFQDTDFTDSNNQPQKLTQATFAELCRRYSSDVPESVMRKELVRVGAIRSVEGNLLEVVSRFYMPASSDAEWLANAAGYVADLAQTINTNFDRNENQPSSFLGRATEPRIPRQDVDEFHQLVEEAGQEFLERIDAWLMQHQSTDTGEQEAVRLGVGVFLIKGDNDSERYL